ncbi:MAG: hypothetical protein DRP83_00335 [Planctomycetota bacterium]|nr:MAG: hypothetical protein DRP83_00335 [Planctomycetota bacterium]
MANTEISQTREQVLNAAGEQVYRVISVVAAKGDLPHQSIFVLSINDASDPTSDTFLRVASPFDLTNLYTDRPTAIANSATIFLSPYVNNDYSDLEVAMQATQEIDGRVNTLVTTWQTYFGEFYTPTSETLTFPNFDPSYVQELKAAYAAAKEARETAESDLEDKTTTLTDAEDALADAVGMVELFAYLVQVCDKLMPATTGYWAILNAEITSYVGGTNSLFNAMKTAYEVWSTIPWVPSSPPAPTEDYFDMYNALNAWYGTIKNDWETVGVPQVANVTATLTDACNNASSEYTSALNDQTNAASDVADAQEAKDKATATLAAAQEAEDAALAAVVAVCPDFDPASV